MQWPLENRKEVTILAQRKILRVQHRNFVEVTHGHFKLRLNLSIQPFET